MLAALVDFVQRLRDAGVPVSMVESLDAVAALRELDLGRRAHVRAALAATLVKRPEHAAAFGELFDRHFGRRAPEPAMADLGGAGGASAGTPPDLASTDLLEALGDALARDDTPALRALAALAVRQFGGIDAARAGSATYHLYRVMHRLDLSRLLQRALREARESAEPADRLAGALHRAEQGRRVEALRQIIADAVRDRLAQVRGREAPGAHRHPAIEDVDFLGATPQELRAMRLAVAPLARKLAARIAQRRRARRRGRLDARRTIRRSLSAGGVPLEPVFRRPRVSRPDLYLLCDVSGSVAEFASFTMAFLHAVSEAFPRIRSFAFVDGVDEVTDLLRAGRAPIGASQLVTRADVVRADGHSDYGAVLERFWSRYGRAGLSPRSTLIVTGDARNNYRAAGADTLRAIRERARRVYWLNPEPRALWDTTDSVMAGYAPHCHGVFEARNLRQLAAFVTAIV